ncbi:hypothetical protein BDV28DRAFT_144678 [Aspergillus coremiiformis]|uniref:Uncharacterized protein n=1 Tax=Aspergillus coremiiformis TaxID=138285 RepID=A0A5N6ZHA0_9EURO|nr:hypothetical protein BDV28DRAFT_144678 [Aspergillus coremiiformis]
MSDEDARLRDAVAVHGNEWAAVSFEVKTRNPDQCSKRWENTLDSPPVHGDSETTHLLITIISGAKFKNSQSDRNETHAIVKSQLTGSKFAHPMFNRGLEFLRQR